MAWNVLEKKQVLSPAMPLLRHRVAETLNQTMDQLSDEKWNYVYAKSEKATLTLISNGR